MGPAITLFGRYNPNILITLIIDPYKHNATVWGPRDMFIYNPSGPLTGNLYYTNPITLITSL